MSEQTSETSDQESDQETERETVTAQARLAVEVPKENWIDYLTKNNDIFMHGYCGYWLRGVNRDEQLGWLCWEDGASNRAHRPGTEPGLKEAQRAWRSGEPLPEGWHCLDEAMAIKAFVEGVKLWGAGWFDGDHGDANGYDVVMQLALLGEIRYG